MEQIPNNKTEEQETYKWVRNIKIRTMVVSYELRGTSIRYYPTITWNVKIKARQTAWAWIRTHDINS